MGVPSLVGGGEEVEGSPVVFQILFETNFICKFFLSIICIANPGLRVGRARKFIFELGKEIF